ncbi:phosphohydrolase [Leptolyngbya sp. Heron Island J]|uniref:metallophosphoesterase n=1 Tax=Leptolyngbya sp. Heron Island J TaxID=1385935 RepID=UPI0003B99426|nr:metallophosphoesterase [Leptolyngbya sp. Heron Island J]ESA35677.1 phosphohydrolase [Leptolyngbya sp. Heron Island J]
MSNSILLVQITDSHLLAQKTAQLRGYHPWQSFNAVLQQALRCRPDGLLLTGDLADQGEAAAYGHLVDAIADGAAQLPTYWLPGNHDCLDNLEQMFQTLPCSQGLKAVDLGAWRLILLNSVFPQAKFGEGYLSAPQLQRLRFYLTHDSPKPTLIALHHHPQAVGIDWVDQIQLQNGDQFCSLIEQFSHVKLVVFGHIHHEFQAQTTNGIRLYGCPSTCSQVTPAAAELHDERPGFRLLWLNEDGSYRTEVRRVSCVPASVKDHAF